MRKFAGFIVMLLWVFQGFAQYNEQAPWMVSKVQKKQSNVKNQELSLDEISQRFNNYWKDKDFNAKGSGFKPYKRWEDYWKHATDANGYLPSSAEQWKAYENHIKFKSTTVQDESNWEPIGPNTLLNHKTSIANLGRVNVIVPDPNNENIYYVGTPAGGIWKSIDKGVSWDPLSDNLPQIGVSGIAIDPTNSSIIYIATGDDDNGDTLSAGVFKSVDGGENWIQTGLNPENTPGLMNDIYIHPNDSNILIVATSNGVYKTEDQGGNWSIILNGNINDIKLKPGEPNTIYAATSNKFYRSVDGGSSFQLIETGLPADSGRIVLEVSPANSNYVYVLSAATDFSFQGLYKSTDSGTSFTKTAEVNNIMESNQAWFDLALAVSDTDVNEVYVGCLNIWKSINGGDSFSRLNNWAVRNASFTHADIHYLRFFDGELFAGTDGGFYKSEDGGVTFQDYTQGMQISQFYKVSVAKYDASKIVGGTQDNGGMGLTNSEDWNNYHGGDGMDNAINPLDVDQYFGFSQLGGFLNVSNNAGLNNHGSYPGPEEGNWVTPLVVNNEGEVYAGYQSVYRFTGTSFGLVSSAFEAKIDVLTADDLNADNMYAGVNKKFYRSSDRGINFEETYAFEANINSIEVNSENNDIIYVLTSGFGTRGAFKSTDRGETFENITFNLPPDQPYFDVVHQGRNALNPIYVGTSLGVYKLDDSADEWQIFSAGLPNVPVRDLEISLEDAKLVVATYGRGIWRSNITTEIPEVELKLVAINSPTIDYVNCEKGFSLEVEVENQGITSIESVDIIYEIDGVEAVFEWTGMIDVDAVQVISVDNLIAEYGIHELEVTINTPNDSYADNNSLKSHFLINKAGIPNKVNDFEEEKELITYNDSKPAESIWERGVPAGTLLNTAGSGNNVYGTNLDGVHADFTKGYIYSECYDLSTTISPKFEFKMAYDLEENWDIIYVEYSIDNGGNWQVLGSSSDPNWYNSDRTNTSSGNSNDCQNCPGAQWTGTNTTLTQYTYDLTSLASETEIVFRFVFHSDPFEHQEGVVIDDFVISRELIDDEDDDDDGILDVDDNCPVHPNADQSDLDEDGIGDECDEDRDGDGILNVDDNCPSISNEDQADLDEDGIGDVCDDDNDGDGILDVDDNCPLLANEDQADLDEDGIGDVCDDDKDGDGILDVDDNCPAVSNADQADQDNDSIGDVCDEDIDGDGIIDVEDNCPTLANTDQADLDQDGIGDVCDEDMDGDGILNTQDTCNNTPLDEEIDETGCTLFTLPTDNFRLEIQGETCRSSDDGTVVLTAMENLNYTATLTGLNRSDANEFTENTGFENLISGTYEICITVENQRSYKSCFDVVISEPEDLSVFSKVDAKSKTMEINMKGGVNYEVNLNGKSIRTEEPQLSLGLRPGRNELKVSTDVLCQGVYEETIIIPFDGAVLYPNPVKRGELLYLTTADIEHSELEITVYTESGSKLISGIFNNPAEKRVEIDVKYLPLGVYFLYVEAGEVQKSYTFIIE
jgi:photosystem II stability/assembly factor-like uncharacterized protein